MATEEQPPARAGRTERIERAGGRALVVATAAFWIAAGVASYASTAAKGGLAIMDALWPLLGSLIALGLSWVNERYSALMLGATTLALVVWGVIYAWGPAAWGLMFLAVIGPGALAATLLVFAARAREQREDSAGS